MLTVEKVGVWTSSNACIPSIFLDYLLGVSFYDYMSKLFPIFYVANFVCFILEDRKLSPNINYMFSWKKCMHALFDAHTTTFQTVNI